MVGLVGPQVVMPVRQSAPGARLLPQPLYAEYVEIAVLDLADGVVSVLAVSALYGNVTQNIHCVALSQLQVTSHKCHVVSANLKIV